MLRGQTPLRGSIGRMWTLGNEMKCPHCSTSFHDNWNDFSLARQNYITGWKYRSALCPACVKLTIELMHGAHANGAWWRCFPTGANRGPVSTSVPANLASDFVEADRVLPISPKASAALSRRCLQAILRDQGYKARDLAAEIDLLLNEPDPAKGIPRGLRETVDAIRNFGNFSAHPISDVTELQVIDVEPHEAEWCLEIIEELFQHFYVRPAEAAARKAALNAKLAAAGKPPAK